MQTNSKTDDTYSLSSRVCMQDLCVCAKSIQKHLGWPRHIETSLFKIWSSLLFAHTGRIVNRKHSNFVNDLKSLCSCSGTLIRTKCCLTGDNVFSCNKTYHVWLCSDFVLYFFPSFILSLLPFRSLCFQNFFLIHITYCFLFHPVFIVYTHTHTHTKHKTYWIALT